MHFKGITVEILDANGDVFQEYKDPIDLEDSDNMTQALIELPPPDAGQNFSIRFSSNNGKYFGRQ